MLYFLQGSESYLIDQAITKIQKEQKIENDNLVHYSALEVAVDMLQLEMNSEDIFGGKKLLVLADLEQVSLKDYLAQAVDADFPVLQTSSNILVVVFKREEALSKTLQKELAQLLNHAQVIQVTKNNEQGIYSVIKKELQDYQHNLTQDDCRSLAQKYQNNLQLVVNELQRVKLEKGKNELITSADFKSNSQFLEEQVFDLIGALEHKNADKTFVLLDNMLLHQQNMFGLLALLLKNYKEMYQIKALSIKGATSSQIATRLAIHPYRTKILLQQGANINEQTYQKILQEIITTERTMKQGRHQTLAIKELILSLLHI